MRRKWLKMLTWKILLTDSSVVFSNGSPIPIPALLTRIVGLPTSERTEEAQEAISSGEVTSHLKKDTLGAAGIVRRAVGMSKGEEVRTRVKGQWLDIQDGNSGTAFRKEEGN